MESIKEYLQTVKLFSGLSDEEIELLARAAEERHFPEGAQIVRKGESGSSAFVLKEGAAEILLERPTGKPVHLAKIGPGEVFGELALLDGETRSASVVATRDTMVIEIKRDLFLEEVAKHPEMSLKLLSVLAQRLRRTESIVSDYADKIYGDVLPRLEKAVDAQLDSAKTITEQSKERLVWISEKAEDSLAQAKSLKTSLKRVVSIVGALLTFAAGVAGFFGYQSYASFAEKWNEKLNNRLIAVEKIKVDVQLLKSDTEKLKSDTEKAKEKADSIVAELQEDTQFLKALKTSREAFEKLLVDELRRNLQLKGVAPVVSGEPASDLSRTFSVAYRRLLRDVLGKPENWESVTLVNALDILAEIWRRKYVRLDEEEVEEEEEQEEWESVIGAIEQAVHHPPAHWLERRRLGDVVERLYKLMGDVYPVAKRALTEEIQNLLSSEFLLGRGEEQAVLVAASLDIDHPQVSKTLNKLREDKSRWRRSQAAVTLITLGKEAGWQTLRTDLAGQFTELPKQTEEQRRGRKRAAYAAAMRLAEIVVYPPEKWSRARHVDIQELERHLSRKSLLEELATFPEAEPAGTDLVGKTLLSRLTDSSRRRDRFTWQYSCELICSLGCKKTKGTEGGRWCAQCFDKFEDKYFKSGAGLDRSAESCPAPRDKLPITSGSVPAKPAVSSS